MKNKDSLSFVFDPNNISFEDSMTVLLYLDSLDNSSDETLKVEDIIDYEVIIEHESEYDLSEDSVNSNSLENIVPSILTSYVKRDDVYSTVKNLIKPDRIENILLGLDTRYPKQLWEDYFPRAEVTKYLFNEKRECFIY